jgi:drug/metabolite transporter (DMT)-like permease
MKLHKSARAGLLGLAALIWGTAFVAQSMGMDHLGPCAFNGARSFVGAMALLPVIAVGDRLRRHAAPEEAVAASWKNPALLLGGLLCGLFLGAASLLQQAGLQSTTAGKAGFLTSLYIVFVPVLGLFLGHRGGKKLWLAVALALGGAYLLSVAGGLEDGGDIGRGDGLVLASAALFSFHILVIDRFSPRVDGVKLSCLQFFVAGLVSTLLALTLEGGFCWEDLLASWGPLLYTGILSSGVGYTLQIVGQRGLDPAAASLILSLESVFAAVSGWLVLGQPLSLREMAGCALVFAGVVLAQLPEPKTQKE